MAETLHRFTRELDGFERERLAEGGASFDALEKVVERHGQTVPVDVLDGLMRRFHELVDQRRWASAEESDRWLAPRLHAALRLTRSEAGHRGLWHWLALRYRGYVTYRWTGAEGVARERWFGAINKQALARLWWGAELFRDGEDYSPVEFLFIRQDMPNSYLHRPLVRCRPLALGMVDQLQEIGGDEGPKASQVNDLARVLNLTTAGIPPEAETGFVRDDAAAYDAWLQAHFPPNHDWDKLPLGPSTGRRSDATETAGRRIAARGWALAPSVAEAVGAKGSAKRSLRGALRVGARRVGTRHTAQS
ncbi:DUF6339 family protein [Geodermatophilus sp. SYSU D00779]